MKQAFQGSLLPSKIGFGLNSKQEGLNPVSGSYRQFCRQPVSLVGDSHHDSPLLGATDMAAGDEHLTHLLAWAIQRGETARDLLTLPFYHPVVDEMLLSALQGSVRQLPVHNPYPLGLVPIPIPEA